ncbi:MAG TPA: LacI family DNA-binding transcriptional regulator [Flavisolibacter sp.]|nr:LacI family DNA-binding transcriptional regulator [Flavisolibacter sp.]
MAQVTLKTLAKKLNLSVSTVSKAFRDSFDISADTKEKILALAASMNYQPNAIASSLRTNKSKTIAVILPEIANHFFHLAIDGIESIASEEGYHVLIYLTHEDYKKEVAFTKLAENKRADGIIVALSQQTNRFSHFADVVSRNIPLVFFDRIHEHAKAPKVSTNDFESSYRATEHLIKQGCKTIAHLTFSGSPSIAVRRQEGYLKALRDYNLRSDPSLIVQSTGKNERDLKNIKALLSGKSRPDGIFSGLEKMAMISYEACAQLDISIPEEIRIITYSNMEIAPLLNPPLSTVTQPAFQIGRNAAILLFQMLKKGSNYLTREHLVIDSQLMLRRSTLLSSFFFFLESLPV